MDTAQQNQDLWEEIMPTMSWSLRLEDLPSHRFTMPRESVLKLRELVYGLTGEDDPEFLIHLVVKSSHRSTRYVTCRVNSLYAFRHLAPARYFEYPLLELNNALNGLVPEYDRDIPYDYSEPERYAQSLPLMETLMGILRFRTLRLLSEFCKQEIGSMSLSKELASLVAKHPDKAALIPAMLRDREFTRNDLSKIEEMLATESASLLEGTL